MYRPNISTLLPALLCALCTTVTHAATEYAYEGMTFSTATPPLTTADRIIGTVTFSTEPTPNETGKSDVIAYSFAAGSVVYDNNNSSHLNASSPLFDFDANLNVTAWFIDIGTANQFDAIRTNNMFGPFEDKVWILGELSYSATAGTWMAVPEPSCSMLLFVAIVLFPSRRHHTSAS